MCAYFYDARNITENKKMEKERKEKKKDTFQKRYEFKNSELYARGPEGYQMVQFYSKSKDKDAKYLSTLQRCNPPLQIDGKGYISVEHYFQSQKYPFDKRYLFQVGGEIEDPKQAKRAGSKSGMAKYGVKLDLDLWNGMSQTHPNEFYRIRVMKKAIHARLLELENLD